MYLNQLILVVLLSCICNIKCQFNKTVTFGSHIWQYGPEDFDPKKVEELRSLLFPPMRLAHAEVKAMRARERRNLQSKPEKIGYGVPYINNNNNNNNNNNRRNLVSVPTSVPTVAPTEADEITCKTCNGMEYCSILEGDNIQETYYPDVDAVAATGNTENLEDTCKILDLLGKRMSAIIFGSSLTFRDTAACRDIVLQYLCLFWGSDNNAYVNGCRAKEDSTSEDTQLHVTAPRPPCRSFCVQVAELCANDHHFLQLCYDIVCPPTAEDCVADPEVKNNEGVYQSLNAGLLCNIPFQEDPYNSENAATNLFKLNGRLYLLVVLLLSILFLFFPSTYDL